MTVFHSVTKDLGLEMPWPKPADYVPPYADAAILIWGGSSSVGQFAIQILQWYGYKKVLVTASTKHHEKLQSLGAKATFDYNNPEVVASIQAMGGRIPLILDCIGSKSGSIEPISRIAKKGAKVAILLPVIVRDSSETEDPIYDMDVTRVANWEDGVDARGVRTHFYPDVSTTRSFDVVSGAFLMPSRTSSSSTTYNPTLCTRFSKTVLSRHKSKELYKEQRCWNGHKRQWTCCDGRKLVWSGLFGEFARTD